jgi:hypothetical protein
VLKLDLRKAYDCIDWDFLRLILLKVGMGLQVTNWIMSCVTSSSFVVLINGEATEFFRSGRGVRQVCPLSPLLFILVMEGLNLLLKHSFEEGHISGIKVSRMTRILHLMFVDDVLILSKASLSEWKVIASLISCFCKASGLSVNQTKSTIHFEGLSDLELNPFKTFLPYTFNDLSLGFCYLGYFLKTGAQRAADWDWLVTRVSNKINLWCNRWLSLGGRYILVKSVLEGQNVYWMSMEALPRIILNRIRKLMFQFLWTGHSEAQQYHLCRWEILSRPKNLGGWGFCNLPLFNLALNASTLWRVLTQPSIWQKVIKEKYLHNATLINWIRQSSHQCTSASRIWTSLSRALPVINHWLSWYPGAGHLIVVGRDRILGMGDRSFLSDELITSLKEKNVSTLAQASTERNPITFAEVWRSSEELELLGAHAIEWNNYTMELSHAGITLQEGAEDKLLWNGGDSSGKLSVRNCYNAILSTQTLPIMSGWKFNLWKWRIQLKIILFFWLATDYNILTWDVLQKKGWVGPGYCYLCREAAEDSAHLFVHCHFTQVVWTICLSSLKLNYSWIGQNLNDCMETWLQNKATSKKLPFC